jgi:hypothetical protein
MKTKIILNLDTMKIVRKKKFFTIVTLLCVGLGWGQFSHSGTTITQTGTLTDLSDLLSESYSDGISYSSTAGNDNSVISEYRAVGNQGNRVVINGTQTINAKTDLPSNQRNIKLA